MKLAVLMGLLLSLRSEAATSFTFFPATDGSYVCTTHGSGSTCTGFVTSSQRVGAARVAVALTKPLEYNLSISIDHVSYSAAYVLATTATTVPFQAYARDGRSVTLTAYVINHRQCSRSGRVSVCKNHFYVNDGSVQLP